jgi:hypothetical protein
MTLTFLLSSSVLTCRDKNDKTKKSVIESDSKARDSIYVESQVVNFGKGKYNIFLKRKDVNRTVEYSYLDVHDYEDDTFTKGPILQIMPKVTEFSWKYDPKPKVVLTNEQAAELLSIINDPNNYKFGRAFCFFPRNCFCFYNSKNEIIGFLEVCFECSQIESFPRFKNARKGDLTDQCSEKLSKLCKLAGATVR